MALAAAGPPTDGMAHEDIILPPLRQDLEILEGWPKHTGAPSWMLFDPLRNRYFRIDHEAFQLLTGWAGQTVTSLTKLVEERWGRLVDPDEVSELIKFVFGNQLTNDPPTGSWQGFAQQAEATKKGLWNRALHNYLFFKIPLLRPDRFLRLSWPLVKPLFSRLAALAFAFLGLFALYLVSRQWDAFVGQFIAFLSWEGLFYYGAALVFVKICHELGHAYMATRYGLTVPVIGVAFLVLMPVLYTDTSNAWRLKSRRQRLMIDGAGIFTELALAVVATLVWIFLPEGPVRAAAFSVATVGWLFSLAVNLNPFMRFDGYYILSDLLGFENMQARGFALGRWRMRELLFRPGRPKPELLEPALERFVILHAWGTWVYRFFLFLGIALLIYAFFIKTVAILLFVVEILWFIVLPIFRELKEWWTMRADILSGGRGRLTLTLTTLAFALFVLPLSSTVSVPAVMRAGQETTLYPPMAAKLDVLNVRDGQSVQSGDVVARFSSEKLELDIILTKRRIALLERRIARGASDVEDGALRRILMGELSAEKDNLKGHQARQAELVVRAPIGGVVRDLDPAGHAGRTLARNHALFRIAAPGTATINGLVAEEQVERLTNGTPGTFLPDDVSLPKVDIVLASTAQTAAVKLRDPDLGEIYGGAIATRPVEGREQAIVGSYYPLVMQPTQPVSLPGQTVRGIARLKGERRSLAGRMLRRVAGVLIRESGF